MADLFGEVSNGFLFKTIADNWGLKYHSDFEAEAGITTFRIPFGEGAGPDFTLFVFVHELESLLRIYGMSFQEESKVDRALSLINCLNTGYLLDSSLDLFENRFRLKFNFRWNTVGLPGREAGNSVKQSAVATAGLFPLMAKVMNLGGDVVSDFTAVLDEQRKSGGSPDEGFESSQGLSL
ncbi:hypothetical protein [Achromobacter spanius]|uniref:hypothetical protein n=1 Tax=Achromobacter spanius TaxID=217203 RepID=UPI0037F68366